MDPRAAGFDDLIFNQDVIGHSTRQLASSLLQAGDEFRMFGRVHSLLQHIQQLGVITIHERAGSSHKPAKTVLRRIPSLPGESLSYCSSRSTNQSTCRS